MVMIFTKHPQGATNTSERMETRENDFYDAKQHTYEVVNANKDEKVKNNTPSSDIDGNEPTLNSCDTLDTPTLVSDEASKKEDDFFNAEKHTYSVVNAKHKKRANDKLSDDERERERRESLMIKALTLM